MPSMLFIFVSCNVQLYDGLISLSLFTTLSPAICISYRQANTVSVYIAITYIKILVQHSIRCGINVLEKQSRLLAQEAKPLHAPCNNVRL